MFFNNIICKFGFSICLADAAKKCLLIILISFSLVSCKKFLAEKPNKSVRLITSLQDLQALMDDPFALRTLATSALTIPSDEYYFTSATWASLPPYERDSYIWDKDAVFNHSGWKTPYEAVYLTNVILQELPKVKVNDNDSSSYNNIKGSALFFRSYAFYLLAQSFCRPWSSTASTDLGIALRMVPDLEVKSVRATVQQTYDQIINDLKEAANLLPETGLAVIRPTKAAVYAALARTYLSMRDYVNAGVYADSCLRRYSTLLDYNTLNLNLQRPFTNANPEIIFYCEMLSNSPTSNGLIDTTLYQSYVNNDLRKTVFFLQTVDGYMFRGDYYGSIFNQAFCGIATDEMYLTRAECFARAGNKDLAMADLNTLLIKRWKTGTFVPFTATDATDALTQVLTERKKELIFRGLRWMDLRRFNLEGANITLTRIINGITYTLPPNDLRWVLLIPWEAVINRTGMPQNPR